jgi:hypothetical protein
MVSPSPLHNTDKIDNESLSSNDDNNEDGNRTRVFVPHVQCYTSYVTWAQCSAGEYCNQGSCYSLSDVPLLCDKRGKCSRGLQCDVTTMNCVECLRNDYKTLQNTNQRIIESRESGITWIGARHCVQGRWVPYAWKWPLYFESPRAVFLSVILICSSVCIALFFISR